MFGEMRSAVGIPDGEDILDYIYSLPEKQQPEAHEKIQAVEVRSFNPVCRTCHE